MTNMHNSAISRGNLYIGLPMWQHSHWPNTWFANYPKSDNALSIYAQECNTVEGNTTFYSLPHQDAVIRWANSVNDDFRFTFKFHQNITHELNVAVEERHLAFFAKGDEEKALNQVLIRHNANRIIMDTRALFTGPCNNALLEEVRDKKPRVPVNVIATGSTPVVRFVGNDVDDDNLRCLTPWVKKVHQWLNDGKDVYFFCHRPDNKDAPWLAQQFIDLYNYQASSRAFNNLSIKHQPEQNPLF